MDLKFIEFSDDIGLICVFVYFKVNISVVIIKKDFFIRYFFLL